MTYLDPVRSILSCCRFVNFPSRCLPPTVSFYMSQPRQKILNICKKRCRHFTTITHGLKVVTC